MKRDAVAIVAMADNGVIGRQGGLPWKLSTDLRRFKATTMGKPVIMGRKTWDSLYVKPLKERQNMVVSRNPDLELPDGAVLCASLREALDELRPDYGDGEEAMLIGGGTLFAEAMSITDRIYLTRVHTSVPDADVYFPELKEEDWEKVWEEPHPADERHAFAFSFQKWERRRKV